MGPLKIVLIVLGVLALCALAFAAGVLYRKRVGEREIGSAEEEATRIINEAIRGGENRKKELLLEAKDEIHKSRTEYEKEVKERRAELTKNEFGILRILMENRGRTVSREGLMSRLWQTDCYVDENTLTVNVARLRRKLEGLGLTDFILTKKGMGYLVE